MTHAKEELERLQKAFEKWSESPGERGMPRPEEFEIGHQEAAALFWPFVAYALSDMQGSAEKTAMFNRFKAALGMELMAHERVGVEND